MQNEPTTRPWWKLGPFAWLGIALLVFINIAFLTNWIPCNRLIASRIVCSLDPYTWPLWVSSLLWCAVLWKCGDLDCWPKSVSSIRQIAKPMSILIFILAVGYQNNWHLATQQTKLYYRIYTPYIIGPLSRFIHDGYWDWKTFILPSIAFVVLFGLAVLFFKTRRMKEEDKEKKSEQLRGQVGWFVILIVTMVLFFQVPTWVPQTWKSDIVRIVRHLYQLYVIAPMAAFISTGYWDWKTFLFPAASLFVLGGLLCLAIRLRRRNRETKSND